MNPYQLHVSPQPARDSQWFERLSAIGVAAGEIYTVLGPTAAELQVARSAFEAGKRQHGPDLRPTTAGLNAFIDTSTPLSELREQIIQEESDAVVRAAYVARLDELLLHLHLLRSAQHDASDFQALNQTLYGQPDSEICAATWHWLRVFVEECADHPLPAVRLAGRRALSVLPSITVAPASVSLLPDTDTFTVVRNLHHKPGGYIDQLFGGTKPPTTAVVTARTGDPLVRRILDNVGSDYSLMDAPDGLWGVVHSRRAVVRPAGFTLARDDFYDLLVHEIGSHTLEYVNGYRGPLRLLALGLDRYDHCNEGRAYLREQIMHASPSALVGQHSWQYHVLIHLCLFLAIEHGYDFAAAYAVVEPLADIWEALRHPTRATPPRTTSPSHDIAWTVVTRALKGTDGTGGAYYKDLIYVQGNVKCWQLARSQPELILYGDYGKFDICRPDHLATVRSFGLLPAA